MKQMEKATDLGLLIMSTKAQLVQVQSLEIMLEGHVAQISAAPRGGELCEVLEEIANVYLNLAERIECARAVNSTIVEPTSQEAGRSRLGAEILI